MVTCGAEPLFFLDYFAASTLEPKSTAKIVKGIANACKKSNWVLGNTTKTETASDDGHIVLEASQSLFVAADRLIQPRHAALPSMLHRHNDQSCKSPR